MPSKPMQRSLKHLKDNGWTVAIVEKWKKFPGMKFGVRQDVWGFGDILACRGKVFGDVCSSCGGRGEFSNQLHGHDTRFVCGKCAGYGKILISPMSIALVQTTDHTSHAKHREKILAEFDKKGKPNEIKKNMEAWKAAGGIVLLHSWGKRGPRGKRKFWQLKEEVL